MSRTVIDLIRNQAETRPGHPALISQGMGEDTVVSYASLWSAVEERISVFEDIRVGEGDRCGLRATNGYDFIVGGLAIMSSGQCLVPVSDDYGRPALEGFIDQVRLRRILDFNNPEEVALHDYADHEGSSVDGRGDEVFRSLRPAFIRFTSGTTNERKGVVIGHRAILDRLEVANRGLGISPEDRILWVLPMAHHFLVSILLYLSRGATILLPRSQESSTVLKMAKRYQSTVFYASPQDYSAYLEEGPSTFPTSLRLAVSTSNGLSEEVALRFHRQSGIPLTQALGIIEVGLPVMNRLRADRKPLALGQMVEGVDIILKSDETGRMSDLGSDAGVGEICIKAPGMFDAYLKPWVRAEEVLIDGYFATGDLGYFDEDEDLYVLGRRKNRVVMGGRKFFCEEVEAVINSHPEVAESRVFAEPAETGAGLIAEVVPLSGKKIQLGEIRDLCESHLGSHKIPYRYDLVDFIEKTSTGKIKRW